MRSALRICRTTELIAGESLHSDSKFVGNVQKSADILVLEDLAWGLFRKFVILGGEGGSMNKINSHSFWTALERVLDGKPRDSG